MWFKRLDSKEYIKLFSMIEELRIRIETIKLDLDLHKKKLRSKAKVDEKEETKDIYNSVLLPE